MSILQRARERISGKLDSVLAPIEVPGIDVSRWQGVIDWHKVRAAGYQWAIVKISEGSDLLDPRADRNVDEARDAGLSVGAYHFGTWFNMGGDPSGDGAAEANFFRQHCERLGLERASWWLDMEWDGKGRGKDTTPATRTEWAAAWLAMADYGSAHEGRPRAGIYTGANYWRYMMRDSLEFSDRALWLARYKGPPREFKLPGVWRAAIGLERTQVPGWRTTIWQRTGKGKVPGVHGNCDVNLFRGTVAEYDSLFSVG